MKIKWGALVVDGRGKLGGHVAAQNRSGSYLRTKVTPSNPQTVFQSTVRAIFGYISQVWSGLTAGQILAWNEAVDSWKKTNIFGDLKQPSGKNLHQRLNLELLTSGQVEISNPPLKLEMVQGVITAGTLNIAGTSLDLTGSYAGADAVVKFFSSGPVSNGTTFVKNLMRQVYFAPADDLNIAVDAYAGYVAKFGAPVIGQKVYLGAKYVLPNGQASTMQTVLATIV